MIYPGSGGSPYDRFRNPLEELLNGLYMGQPGPQGLPPAPVMPAPAVPPMFDVNQPLPPPTANTGFSTGAGFGAEELGTLGGPPQSGIGDLSFLARPYEDLMYDKPESPFQADVNATLQMMKGTSEWLREAPAYAAGSAVGEVANYFGYDEPQWAKTAEQEYLDGNKDQRQPPPGSDFYSMLAKLGGEARPRSGGIGGGGVTSLPLGEAYPDMGELPQQQVASAVDYGPAMERVKANAPTRREVDPWTSGMEGAFLGLRQLGEADNIGEALLGVGSGILGGALSYKRDQQDAQSDFDEATREHNLRLAELELSKAEVDQRHRQSVMDVDFQNRMASREEAVRKWEAAQPQVLSASGGVLAYTAVGPDGKKTLTMDTRPAFQVAMARSMAKSLGGGDFDDFPVGSDDPGEYAAWAAGRLAEEPGMAQMLFADDPESLQEIQNSAYAEASQLAFGDKQQNLVLQQLLHSKLTAYLMQNPQKAQQIIMQMGLQ